jgi:hypothetical protein
VHFPYIYLIVKAVHASFISDIRHQNVFSCKLYKVCIIVSIFNLEIALKRPLLSVYAWHIQNALLVHRE